MKIKKLLKQLAEFFELSEDKLLQQQESVKTILKKLREKEHRLIEELEQTQDEEQRSKLQSEIEIIHAQRTKGVSLLKDEKPDP